MNSILIVVILFAAAFILSNPDRSKELVSKVAPILVRSSSDSGIDELYRPLYELVPAKNHPEINKAKELTVQFKAECLLDPQQLDYVRLSALKSRIVAYLQRATFFLPNDLQKELELRGYIQKISMMLQQHLYQLFGMPFDTFGYSSMQDQIL
jgi:hypothetical protein